MTEHRKSRQRRRLINLIKAHSRETDERQWKCEMELCGVLRRTDSHENTAQLDHYRFGDALTLHNDTLCMYSHIYQYSGVYYPNGD